MAQKIRSGYIPDISILFEHYKNWILNNYPTSKKEVYNQCFFKIIWKIKEDSKTLEEMREFISKLDGKISKDLTLKQLSDLRLVFEPVKKYDEIGVRYIPIPKIKQIAGRASRFGTENAVGEVTAIATYGRTLCPSHQLLDVKEFVVILSSCLLFAFVFTIKLIANTIELISMTIPERFTFVTGYKYVL
ncbi:P-loop containing nucleoside triphosphate hydrolase protein [Gigaspora margarita]|uniref:P-loop containing nucleoside triphosphate hydrolase protein n=1 Tax=Gigaspora margarita TaxID=4874 RepID=A0A8H4A134_GIGMA|nr:P-loop containing nucleoside triphosphate hydrolase protein [Gigaspora margarita]